MGELQDFFKQGDKDLRATAGQPGVLIRRRSHERVPLTVVAGPAEVALTMPSTTGGLLTCDRTMVLSREECTRRPEPGDVLEVDGWTFEVLRVTGWAMDTSWHVDVALRKR